MPRTSMLCRVSGAYRCLECEEEHEENAIDMEEGNRFPPCPKHRAVWWILSTAFSNLRPQIFVFFAYCALDLAI